MSEVIEIRSKEGNNNGVVNASNTIRVFRKIETTGAAQVLVPDQLLASVFATCTAKDGNTRKWPPLSKKTHLKPTASFAE